MAFSGTQLTRLGLYAGPRPAYNYALFEGKTAAPAGPIADGLAGARLSVQRLLNRCFDPSNNILRLGTIGGDMAGLNQFSVQEIFNRVFDPNNNQIVTSGTNTAGKINQYSVQEILNRCFDEDNNSLATS